MAGIGFELRKLLDKQSYSGLLQAYVYAGVISSGPWVLSIIGIMMIGIISIGALTPHRLVVEFQVTVTYIMATSLTLTGVVQIAFTRYIADRLYEKRHDWVLPNFNGMLTVVVLVSGTLGLLAVVFLFPQQSVLYRLLVLSGFVIMCATWVTAVFLSGMKKYKQILLLFLLGYTVVVTLSILLREFGVEGLLLSFVFGHYLLLMGMILLTYRDYQSEHLISFDLFERGAMFVSLMLAGLFYNAAVWADKFMFWFNPHTSQAVVGPLRASVIYDFPIFLAYLSVIPGMAVFLVRIETNFVEYYDKFYNYVREGAPLSAIERTRNNLSAEARNGLLDIAKVQAIVILLVFALGSDLLAWLGVSQNYLPLLCINVVAAGLQVILLGILNIMFYLDKRRLVVGLTLLFLISNIVFTAISQALGVAYFGYGFAFSLVLTVVTGLAVLSRCLNTLEYETFMLQ